MKVTINLSLILFSIALASCASQPSLIATESLLQEAVESSLAPEKTDLPLEKISSESLYDLLVGDVALSRNQFDTALAKYSYQARVTNDQEVIKLKWLNKYIREGKVFPGGCPHFCQMSLLSKRLVQLREPLASDKKQSGASGLAYKPNLRGSCARRPPPIIFDFWIWRPLSPQKQINPTRNLGLNAAQGHKRKTDQK